MTKPKLIPIDQIKPNPKNPRLLMREDVVSAIAEQLNGNEFDSAHALMVRAVDGHFEIISGHHRKAGAERAGKTEIPCWVREMDDEAAYMALVTSNAQGELSPLEIGF